MKPRITVSLRPSGDFELHLNEAGRDLLVAELQRLDRRSDHFHLDWVGDPEMEDQVEAPLRGIPYAPDDKVLLNGKVLFRPDDWDELYYPHVLEGSG